MTIIDNNQSQYLFNSTFEPIDAFQEKLEVLPTEENNTNNEEVQFYTNQIQAHRQIKNLSALDAPLLNEIVNAALNGLKNKESKQSTTFKINNIEYKAFFKHKLGETQLCVIENNYRVLGEGGYGTAYLCPKVHSDGANVLKKVKKSLQGKDRATGENDLLKEISLLNKTHENGSVPYIQAAPHATDGFEYIIHKYAASGKDALPNNFSETALTLAQALKYFHDQGIYHRDIKPENMFVDKNGNFYLADLGGAITQQEIQNKFNNGAKINLIEPFTPQFTPSSDITNISNANTAEEAIVALTQRDAFALGLSLFKLACKKNKLLLKKFITTKESEAFVTQAGIRFVNPNVFMSKVQERLSKEVLNPKETAVILGLLNPTPQKRITMEDAITILNADVLPPEFEYLVAPIILDTHTPLEPIVDFGLPNSASKSGPTAKPEPTPTVEEPRIKPTLSSPDLSNILKKEEPTELNENANSQSKTRFHLLRRSRSTARRSISLSRSSTHVEHSSLVLDELTSPTKESRLKTVWNQFTRYAAHAIHRN